MTISAYSFKKVNNKNDARKTLFVSGTKLNNLSEFDIKDNTIIFLYNTFTDNVDKINSALVLYQKEIVDILLKHKAKRKCELLNIPCDNVMYGY